VHTGIGKLYDHILQGEVTDEFTHDEWVAKSAGKMIIELLSDVPHYVISDNLVELVASDYKHAKLMKSVKAMVKAGIAHLPFDPILIEFQFEAKRCYVRMQSKPFANWDYDTSDFYAYPILTKNDPRPSNAGGLMMACVDAYKTAVPIDLVADDSDEQPFRVYSIGTDKDPRGVDEDIGVAAVIAMAIAMMMLNTRGVIAEHVDTGKLNKARTKGAKKRPPISAYHVVRVGHVYDAHGKAHDVKGSGRHMPVHWRAGHVRNVRYGPYSEEAKHRPTWIEPCLVNFTGEGPAPLPKKEVTL